jgi:hypothetical protein
MNRAALFFLMFVMSLPARAEWTGNAGEDPMTDVPWAVAHTVLGQGVLPQFGFKCWKGEGLQTSVIVGPAALVGAHPEHADLQLRVDKGKPVTWSGFFTETGGMVVWSASSDAIPSMVDLLLAIGRAKDSLGVAFGGMSYRVDLKGGHEAIERMAQTCGLQ